MTLTIRFRAQDMPVPLQPGMRAGARGTGMLVCHCNVISERELEDVVLEFLREDAWQLIVPAKVYHAMEKRGRCCSCFPNVVDIIIRVTENYHLQMGADADRLNELQARLARLRRRHGRIGGRGYEGRTAGHRAA